MRVSFFILFILFIFSSCSSEYNDHFFGQHPELVVSQTISGEGFLGKGELESLPNRTTQNQLISRIENARERIWVEIYTWTDAAHLTDPIIRAHVRGVDVRVILEGNVFGTPQINSPIAKKLKSAGINVVYADNHRYRFTHAKFWIIDQTFSISTGNWTASFFTKNREYIYTDTDSTTLHFLEKIFLSDRDHRPFQDIESIPPHIVMSPLDTRQKLESLISRTEHSLVLYVQTLDDEEILDELNQLIQSGKRVEICTADNDSNRARQKEFSSWHWKLIKKPYLHAKVILRDGEEIFVGSHNLTTNAIQNNREMGIILLERSDIIRQIESDFIDDGCR